MADATIEEPKSVPIKIPECIRKSKKVCKPRKHKKKIAKKEPEMSKEELRQYFMSLQNDPNFGMLLFPRFIQEENPEVFAEESEKAFKERMKRIDFMERLEKAETEEEKEAIRKEREEELKVQNLAFQKIPIPSNTNPYKS